MSENFFLLAFTQFAIYNVIIFSLYIIFSRNLKKNIRVLAYGLLLFSLDAFREFLFVFGTKMGLRSEIEEYIHFSLVLPVALFWALKIEKNKDYNLPNYLVLVVCLELILVLFFKLELVSITSFLNKYAPIIINFIGFCISLYLLLKKTEESFFTKFLKNIILICFLIFTAKLLFDITAIILTYYDLKLYYSYFYDSFLIVFIVKCSLLLLIGVITILKLKRFKNKFSNYTICETYDNSILKLIEEKKYYTNKDLTIEKLAYLLNTDIKSLREIIKQEKQSTFNNYINSLRLNYFLSNLSSSALEKTTILGIAEDAGFKSKSTFNRVFKDNFNCTPSQYIQKQYNNTQKKVSN